jgi:hypothetical protein
MATDQINYALSSEDQRLVRLVTAALANPRMALDLRESLHEKLTELLTVPLIQGDAGERSTAHQSGPETGPDGVARMLESVLTDPSIHTETRMRLHHEISQLLGPTDTEGRS